MPTAFSLFNVSNQYSNESPIRKSVSSLLIAILDGRALAPIAHFYWLSNHMRVLYGNFKQLAKRLGCQTTSKLISRNATLPVCEVYYLNSYVSSVKCESLFKIKLFKHILLVFI